MTRSARDVGLEVRVGLHSGEVEFVGDNVRGVTVHAAARVLSLAGASEVIVSNTTRDLLEGSGIDLVDAGRHVLKGLSGERQVYRVVPG
jgi:class 3 adenylate cyclase